MAVGATVGPMEGISDGVSLGDSVMSFEPKVTTIISLTVSANPSLFVKDSKMKALVILPMTVYFFTSMLLTVTPSVTMISLHDSSDSSS